MRIIKSIQHRIYEIRGQRVMLDFDLASLYEVETNALNREVKRNGQRFPQDFMFRLTLQEWTAIRSQTVTASEGTSLQPQNSLILQTRRHTDITPFAFNSKGVAMLSGILKSGKAINTNIALIRAFANMTEIMPADGDIKDALQHIQQSAEHANQLSPIFEAIENLSASSAAKNKWGEREPIGFRK